MKEKVTMSLSVDVAENLRKEAKEKKTPYSRIVNKMLSDKYQKEFWKKRFAEMKEEGLTDTDHYHYLGDGCGIYSDGTFESDGR